MRHLDQEGAEESVEILEGPPRLHSGEFISQVRGLVPDVIPPVACSVGKAAGEKLPEDQPAALGIQLRITGLAPAVRGIQQPSGPLVYAKQPLAEFWTGGAPGRLQLRADIAKIEDDHRGQGMLNTGERDLLEAVLAVDRQVPDQRRSQLNSHFRMRGG